MTSKISRALRWTGRTVASVLAGVLASLALQTLAEGVGYWASAADSGGNVGSDFQIQLKPSETLRIRGKIRACGKDRECFVAAMLEAIDRGMSRYRSAVSFTLPELREALDSTCAAERELLANLACLRDATFRAKSSVADLALASRWLGREELVSAMNRYRHFARGEWSRQDASVSATAFFEALDDQLWDAYGAWIDAWNGIATASAFGAACAERYPMRACMQEERVRKALAIRPASIAYVGLRPRPGIATTAPTPATDAGSAPTSFLDGFPAPSDFFASEDGGVANASAGIRCTDAARAEAHALLLPVPAGSPKTPFPKLLMAEAYLFACDETARLAASGGEPPAADVAFLVEFALRSAILAQASNFEALVLGGGAKYAGWIESSLEALVGSFGDAGGDSGPAGERAAVLAWIRKIRELADSLQVAPLGRLIGARYRMGSETQVAICPWFKAIESRAPGATRAFPSLILVCR